MQRKHLVLPIDRKHYVGQDSFTYSWTDGLTAGNAATVSIYIEQRTIRLRRQLQRLTRPPTDRPTLRLRSRRRRYHRATGLRATHGPFTLNADGILAFAADGSFTYTPNTHYIGPDSFTYTWSDGVDVSDAQPQFASFARRAATTVVNAYRQGISRRGIMGRPMKKTPQTFGWLLLYESTACWCLSGFFARSCIHPSTRRRHPRPSWQCTSCGNDLLSP